MLRAYVIRAILSRLINNPVSCVFNVISNINILNLAYAHTSLYVSLRFESNVIVHKLRTAEPLHTNRALREDNSDSLFATKREKMED